MVVSQLLTKSNEMLKNAGIQSYILDSHLLLCEFLKKDKAFIFSNKDLKVHNSDVFFAMVQRRASFEPMQYILGRCEFMSLDFEVNPSVLIPRPDTETLVQHVINYVGEKSLSMLEIGTGSGCVSVSCAKSCKNLSITAVDISREALDTAKRNAKKHSIEIIEFVQMNILEDFPKKQFDVVVSNPPYIETDSIHSLMNDVKDFEPLQALDGGTDGLMFYRRIAAKSRGCGFIAFEVGYSQSRAVSKIMGDLGYIDIEIVKDLSSVERVVSAKKNFPVTF